MEIKEKENTLMNNQELIKRCRERLQGEEEPDWQEWTDMVESLCNALEKTDKELHAWQYDLMGEAFRER